MIKTVKLKLMRINKNIITRFSPESNWYLHLGHLKILISNIILSKIYNGKINLRIDDTNPKKNKLKYKKKISNNISFISKVIQKKINKNIFHTSKYFFKLYQYLELIIKNKNKFKILNKLRKTRNGFYKEKKKIIKLFKFKKIYRIIYKKHYKTLNNWFIYPMYDYSQNIADKIENINYSLCGEEFKKNKNIYNLILNLFYKKEKPNQIEIKKFFLKNNILSKSKLKKIFKKKYLKSTKNAELKILNNLNSLKLKKIIFLFKNNNKFKKNNKNKRMNGLIKIKISNFPKNKIKLLNKKYFNKFLILKEKFFLRKKKKNIKILNIKKNYNLKNTNYSINCYKIINKNSFKKKNIKYLKCKIFKLKKNFKKIKWISSIYKNELICNFFYNIFSKNKKHINVLNEKKFLLIKNLKINKENYYNKNIKNIKKNKTYVSSSLYDSNV